MIYEGGVVMRTKRRISSAFLIAAVFAAAVSTTAFAGCENGHSWGEWTPTGSGSTRGEVRTCSACGETERTMIGTAAKLLAFDATCTEPAYEVYYEDDVEISRRETGPALGHDWGEWVSVGTGVDRGEERVCRRCGKKEETKIGTAIMKVVTDASCLEPSYEIIVEDGVEIERKEVSPALGHEFGEWTDAGNGAEKRACVRCGFEEAREKETEKELGPAICKEIEEATCETPEYEVTYENGTETKRVETAPALGHEWSEWKNDPYLCASVGYDRRRICGRCGATQTEHVGTGKHNLEKVYENYENRCTESWYAVEKCRSCGQELSALVYNPTGHSFVNWTVRRKATVFEKGESVRTCGICGKIERKTSAKLKPRVSLNVTSATRTQGKVLALKATGLAKGDSIAGWTSSSPSVASVSNAGRVTAKREGTAYVMVRTKAGATAQCRLTVKSKTVRTTGLTVSGLGVRNGKATIRKGRRLVLSAVRKPRSSTQPVTWKSSNPKVASVTDGKVLGTAEGKALITAASGTKTVAVLVTVTG